MNGRDRAQIKLVVARLKLAEIEVRDAFYRERADALEGAVDALGQARAIDPEIVVGLGRDRLRTLALLYDAIFTLEIRLGRRRYWRRQAFARV